jgi:hypothetical protein
MSEFQDVMRRVITGDNVQGESVVIIDSGPSSTKGNPDLGEMFEIWEDAAFGPLTPKANEDRGAARPVLGPRKGNFQVRWFIIHPQADNVTTPLLMLQCANGLPNSMARVTSSIGSYTQECMRLTRLTSSVCCREKHLSYSNVAKLDCAQATSSYSVGPTTPGRRMVAPRSSWPF